MNTVEKVSRKKEKKANKLCRVLGEDTWQRHGFVECPTLALDIFNGRLLQTADDDALPSVDVCRELNTRKIGLYRVFSALGKDTRRRVFSFVECGPR
jgi:hypothetical protein